MEWRQLSAEEAQGHPLYGFGGWLLAFWILTALGALMGLYNVYNMLTLDAAIVEALQELGITFNTTLAALSYVVSTAAYLPFLILAPSKNPATPKLAIGALVIGFVVSNLLLIMSIPMDSMISGLIVGAVIVGLIILYFMRSKRVNVTYLHRVSA